MSSLEATTGGATHASPRRLVAARALPGLLTLSALVLCAAAALYRLSPPAAKGVGAAPTEFSAGRAFEHLRAVAREPHPVGSAEHDRVREYLVAQLNLLGLETEVQSAGQINNVVARLRGSGGGGACVLLVGHYDSVAAGPGAGDDGSAVAALLETMRALKAAAPPRNDIVVLFSDGEEAGLLGAQAFAYRHPWAGDVRVVLNFDARGSRGPVLMFETGARNGWVVERFAEAAPRPAASSLMSEIYKRLPNDTDFTVFKREGVAGLNFAFIGGFDTYHSRDDTIERLSPDTVQGVGENALALARRLGDARLDEATSSPDAVYFDLLGARLVAYSGRWVTPLAALACLLFLGTAARGFKSGRLRPGQVGLGFLAVPACMAAAAVVLVNAAAFVGARNGAESAALMPDTRQGQLYALGMSAFTIAAAAALFAWFRRHASVESLLAGASVWWLILTAATAALWPGASYLFTWPLLSATAAAPFLPRGDVGARSLPRAAALCLAAAPGLVLLAPLTYLILVALTLKAAALVMMPAALLCGLLAPQFEFMSVPNRWAPACLAALAGLAFFAAAG